MGTRARATPESASYGITFDEVPRFEGHLARAAADVERGVPHALLVIKLDHVAEIGRECGGDAEAALYDVVANALRSQLAADARATRLAGDRLAVLQPRCLPRDAHTLGKRVRAALEGGQFLWKGLSFRIGASVGVLEMTDRAVAPPDQVAKARRASDAAASFGGDGVVVTSGDPEAQIAMDVEGEWREHLRKVI